MSEPLRLDVVIKGYGDKYRFIYDHDLHNSQIRRAVHYLTTTPEAQKVEVLTDYNSTVTIEKNDKVYINVYRAEQMYGGPEEGGWYYEQETPVRIEDVSTMPVEDRIGFLERLQEEYEEGQDTMRDYYSVNARGLYRVRVEPRRGELSPKERPHYE